MPAVSSQRRTLYHSKLRELGPIVAEFASKPRPSKFPGKPEYCHVVIDGQELEYQCESPAIAEQLQEVPLRTPVRIQALGSKDAAYLEVVPVGSSEVRTTAAATSQQNRVAPAPVPAPAPTCSRGYWEALDVAVELVAAFQKRHGREPSDAERAIAATLYIEFNRSGKPLARGAK